MQTFRIIQPTPALKPFIRYYWILQDSTSGIVSQRTLPTGCISLVFHRGERLKVTNRDELQPHSFICGQESGYSDVTSRIFSENIGTTPKDFMRIVRLQRTLSVMQHNQGIGFAQLSYECGYTDQSHMIKELKLFSGYTPKEYIARYSPVSDYFTF